MPPYHRYADAKRLRAWCKNDRVDPKRTDMAKKADIFLQIPVGSNIKTLNTMMNVIISENLQDTEFIEKYAEV